MAGKGNVVSRVQALCAPIAADLGLSLWDVRFVKEGTQHYLRVFIDKDGGVSMDDCVAMSRALQEPLDQEDPCHQFCYGGGIERERQLHIRFGPLLQRPHTVNPAYKINTRICLWVLNTQNGRQQIVLQQRHIQSAYRIIRHQRRFCAG